MEVVTKLLILSKLKIIMWRKKVNDLSHTTRNKLVERQLIISEICALRAPVWDTKTKKMKPRMGIGEACDKAWISIQTFNSWRREDPALDKLITQVNEASMDMIKDISQNIIQDWLTGMTKLRPNEKIQLAKWALEKTSPEFNPTINVKSTNLDISVTMTDEEIIERLKDLWINQIKNDTMNSTIPDTPSEYGEYEETTPS